MYATDICGILVSAADICGILIYDRYLRACSVCLSHLSLFYLSHFIHLSTLYSRWIVVISNKITEAMVQNKNASND